MISTTTATASWGISQKAANFISNIFILRRVAFSDYLNFRQVENPASFSFNFGLFKLQQQQLRWYLRPNKFVKLSPSVKLCLLKSTKILWKLQNGLGYKKWAPILIQLTACISWCVCSIIKWYNLQESRLQKVIVELLVEILKFLR